jgi:raffinose/stachyose/melibiose transport system permease protein
MTRIRSSFFRTSTYLLLGIWTIYTLFPIIWMYYSSVKSLPELTVNKWLPTLHPRWENYVEAWSGVVKGSATSSQTVPIPVSLYFKNSVIVAIGSTLLTMIVASFASYALARRPVPGRKLIIALLIIGLAIPGHALILPLWRMETDLHLTNTYPGLILPYAGTTLPFAILLLMAYFSTFPSEIEDSALIDGCSRLGMFLRIVLPMSKGPIAAIGILITNGFWNEFLYSLILMTENRMRTLPVGLFNFNQEYFTPIHLQLAVLTIATTPILVLFFFFQRQITESMSFGAVMRG